ncbi:MAG: ABC transporter ATP-binding protein [Deltaproteobacteria bacterium]|jgi:branched-chain amino acid transport system ATP-binding protein|nr:ABC transporter ATP-binding protein [Deltaproteobacteria bacterium]
MLKIKNIDAFFEKIQVLRRVSLHVEAGEIVSLIGANGAGKTTLLNVISGLHPSRNGSRVFLDVETRGLKPEKIVALGILQVPETEKVFNPLTVLENLELGAYLRSQDRGQLMEEMEQVYQLFPILRDRKDQLAGTLSGGERQMLALGKALMGQPKLLMLDEPSLGLAPTVVSEIFRIIQSLNERGITILLVEQNAKEALRICRRAYVLDTGRILLTGTGEELLNNEEVKRAFLGKDYKGKWER